MNTVTERVSKMIQYMDGSDHPDVGLILPCRIKTSTGIETKDVELLAVRQRMLKVSLYVSVDCRHIGVAYCSKDGYDSQSFIELDEEITHERLRLALAQLGFSPEGD